MTTTTLNIHVMAADAVRARTASAAGERLVSLALRVGHAVVEFVHAAVELRPREAVLRAAAEQSAERPDLAFSLRRVARNGWMMY